MEALTSSQIHDLMWLGDSPNGQEEHPRQRDLVKLRNRNLVQWNSGRWQLLKNGRLAIRGLESCEAVGCVAKHTFDYAEAPKRIPLARELETLIECTQGILDALEGVPYPDTFTSVTWDEDDQVIELKEALGSAKVALAREEA